MLKPTSVLLLLQIWLKKSSKFETLVAGIDQKALATVINQKNLVVVDLKILVAVDLKTLAIVDLKTLAAIDLEDF